jgi:hypothetical protein
MTLSPGPPPISSVETFREWAARKRATIKPRQPAGNRTSRKRSALTSHSVFVLAMPHVIEGKGPRDAKCLAWRHFNLGPSPKHTISAEILTSNKHRRVAQSYGPSATIVVGRALATLRKKYVKTKKYKFIGLLKIPPLVALAIWVRGRNAKEDLIFPLQSVLPDLKRGVAYTYVDALPLLQRSANGLVSQSLELADKLQKKQAK